MIGLMTLFLFCIFFFSFLFLTSLLLSGKEERGAREEKLEFTKKK